MPTIHYDGTAAEAADGETVLGALLRHGHRVPNSCRAGACQSCMMRCVAGPVSDRSRRSLKPTLRERGYFLACMETPAGDLHVSLEAAAELSVRATVAEVRPLSRDVVRVTLDPAAAFPHRPGQFLNLIRPGDGLVRSYSIASAPGWDGHRPPADDNGRGDRALLELHVRRIPRGRMSNWIAAELAPGDELHVRGPAGDCFYTPGEPDQPMLLAGTGTGLAPLWGIARDALGQGHRGPIELYHGAVDAAGLYMVDELQALAEAHPNVTYRRCLLRPAGDAPPPGGGGADTPIIGPLDEQLTCGRKNLAGWRVFLCGDPKLVQAMRKKAFLAGAGINHIHADAFLMNGS